MDEIWKEIEGFDLPYRISNTGKIMNPKGHIMSGLKNKDIYMVSLRKNSKQKRLTIHRLVAHYFLNVDIDDATLVVKHKDSDALNNHVDNLEVSTRLKEDNSRNKPEKSSGIANVNWYPPLQKWKVAFRNRKCQFQLKHIGYFNLLEDAVAVHKGWHSSLYKKQIPDVKYPGLVYLKGEGKWRVDVFDKDAKIYHIDHYKTEKEALQEWKLYTGILRQS